MAGKTWDFVDQAVLDSDDFSEVRQCLTPLIAVWRSLGTALGLSVSSVNEVQLECRGNPSRCLDQVIEKWLCQDYLHSKFGLPSWRRLVMAVDSNTGGRYPKLARDIAEGHPAHKHKTCSSLFREEKNMHDDNPVTKSSRIEPVMEGNTTNKSAATPMIHVTGADKVDHRLVPTSSSALQHDPVVESLSANKSMTPIACVDDQENTSAGVVLSAPLVAVGIQSIESVAVAPLVDKQPNEPLQTPTLMPEKHEGSSTMTDDRSSAITSHSQMEIPSDQSSQTDKRPVGRELSQSSSEKLAAFLNEPIGDKPVTVLNGIGDKLCECLARKGFDKAYTVLGQFLLLKKDRELFMEWLSFSFDAELQEQLDCYNCLKEWCDLFI